MGDVRSIRSVRLQAAAVTPEAWAPFGAVVSDAGSPTDTADLEFLWNDGHVNVIVHDAGDAPRADGALVCGQVNRHDTHTQTLVPLDGAAVVVVAPAGLDLRDAAHLDAVRAFRVEPLVGVHLARGTWHWGPQPAGAGRVRVLNIQGRGYARDTAVAAFGREHGVTFRVVP